MEQLKDVVKAIVRRTWYLPSLGDRIQNKLRKLTSMAGFHKGGTR